MPKNDNSPQELIACLTDCVRKLDLYANVDTQEEVDKFKNFQQGIKSEVIGDLQKNGIVVIGE